MRIKKYLIISVILMTIGFLGLSISGLAAKYKYGTYPGYNQCGSSGTYSGRMHGIGNMMGPSWSKENAGPENYSFSEVKEKTENYLQENDLGDLQIAEIMEFSKNFYIEVVEKDTGLGAVELLLDKNTGTIFPEYGPNMMWNTKYGMHMRSNQIDADMHVSEAEAIQQGEKYLNENSISEFIGEEADRYHGYYTIHTITGDGDTAGMLSVNGSTGQVWYHSWHGTFIGMEEYETH